MGFTRTLSAQAQGKGEGGRIGVGGLKKSPFPFILARFPSKATNKLQCTFDTN